MPYPDLFSELAEKFGENVDANDCQSVEEFYETEVYNLPEEIRLHIIDELFSRMHDSGYFEHSEHIDHDEVICPPRAEDCIPAKDAWKQYHSRKHEPDVDISIFHSAKPHALHWDKYHFMSHMIYSFANKIRTVEDWVLSLRNPKKPD